jgi:hypothetical protein
MTPAEIIAKVGILVSDVGHTLWTETELLGWINEGQKEIVILKPDACVAFKEFNLVSGSKQDVPEEALGFVRVVRNVNGNTIKPIRLDILDAAIPDWHKATGEPKYFALHPENRKIFYVYPSSVGTVEITYPTTPAHALSVNDQLGLDDIYEASLIDYAIYRSFLKEKDSDVTKSTAYYNKFLATLGVKE